MPDPITVTEELGYFYDTIHGRFALEDLPRAFHNTLKAALSSKTLARLKGISQLGHTSLSFFSATHTRFSHAVGTMLVLDRLYRHLTEDDEGLPPTLFSDIQRKYQFNSETFGSVKNMLHCHLLLVALYQDAGELPFQKVTSLHFKPALSLRSTGSRNWTGKQMFSVKALRTDIEQNRSAFHGYDLDLLIDLMTTSASSTGESSIGAVLQMVDGFAIDADRLDYVYRDALATIGSLSRPNTILESIVSFEPQRVVVNDPRPVTDFLSTRMRLFTFVYNSADVRFRQALLKTILEGYWDSAKARMAFEEQGLGPDLPYDEFINLDDNALIAKISRLNVGHCEPYRQKAKEVLLLGIPEYEYRIIKRPDKVAGELKRLAPSVFFDILADHGHHQLYRPGSVVVKQRLTAKIETVMPLEESAGALSRLFVAGNSPMLVPGGFYLFLPKGWEQHGKELNDIGDSIASENIFQRVQWEDAWRGLSDRPLDTRNMQDQGFSGKAISISFCSDDFPTVVAVVRELFARKRRYWVFLDRLELQGSGRTIEDNSRLLIEKAEAVVAVCSTAYLRKYFDENSRYVNIEIMAMHRNATVTPIVPLFVDERDKLDQIEGWKWEFMNETWRSGKLVRSNVAPLRDATEETIRKAVDAALQAIGQ